MGIFKKEIKKRAFVCGHCKRSIDLSTEPDGKIKKIDGKPACVICRATKLSGFSKQIAKDKIKYETDKSKLEKISQEKALKENKEIAYASQQRIGKRFRLTPKKFLN